MKRLVVACTALLTAGCTPALVEDKGSSPKVEIIWAGTYTGARISSERGANGIIEHQVEDIHLERTTTEIPAKQGIRFGVEYRVSGPPGSTVVELRRRVRYPSPGALVPSRKARLPYDEFTVKCEVGTICMTGYGLDQPWELMTGSWIIEFRNGDQKLVEQSFSITKQ